MDEFVVLNDFAGILDIYSLFFHSIDAETHTHKRANMNEMVVQITTMK